MQLICTYFIYSVNSTSKAWAANKKSTRGCASEIRPWSACGARGRPEPDRLVREPLCDDSMLLRSIGVLPRRLPRLEETVVETFHTSCSQVQKLTILRYRRFPLSWLKEEHWKPDNIEKEQEADSNEQIVWSANLNINTCRLWLCTLDYAGSQPNIPGVSHLARHLEKDTPTTFCT